MRILSLVTEPETRVETDVRVSHCNRRPVHTEDAAAQLKELCTGHQKPWELVPPLMWTPSADSSSSSACRLGHGRGTCHMLRSEKQDK